MDSKNSSGLNFSNTRTEEQIALMKKVSQDGVCPFCVENFKKYHPKPILKETDYWFFTENMSPYKGTKYHFIFVYKVAHVSTPEKISPEATVDLFTLINSAITEYAFPGGAFFMRFGDHDYTGGSVEHLHAHLVLGDRDEPNHEAVKVKLG
jgi:diadenosine tetraphosphate (Ap4A) HIT family hydrolase